MKGGPAKKYEGVSGEKIKHGTALSRWVLFTCQKFTKNWEILAEGLMITKEEKKGVTLIEFRRKTLFTYIL